MHATMMKTKKHYVAPVTLRVAVELEGGFCGSIYETKQVESAGHEVGGDYSFDVSVNSNNEQSIINDFGGSITWE